MNVSLFATFVLISLASFLWAKDDLEGGMYADSGFQLKQRTINGGDRDQSMYEIGGFQLVKDSDREDKQDDKHSEQDMDSARDVENDIMASETNESPLFMVKYQVPPSEISGGPLKSTETHVISSSPHRISARTANVCKFPTNLTDSELDCTTYLDKVTCYQTCLFGYTLEGVDAIRRKMECNMEENRWTPVPEFGKCKPFVDCGVTIGPGGVLKCRKHFMHHGTICDIECSQYEDKEPVPLTKYECDIKGNWTPELPFCARRGSGLQLVPAPHGPRKASDLYE